MNCNEIPPPSSFAYRCDICQEKSISRGKRNIHSRISSLENCFVCKDCNKPFGIGYELALVDEESHLCLQCGAVFSNSELLEVHSYHHNKEYPCRCDICSRASTSKTKLPMEIVDTEYDKPFKCDICGKVFSMKYRLKRHMFVHNGEWPYKCDICGKGWPDKRSLRIHTRRHTKEQPYECIDCGTKFTTKGHLMKHFSRTHGGGSYILEISDSKQMSAIIVDSDEDPLEPYVKVVEKIENSYLIYGELHLTTPKVQEIMAVILNMMLFDILEEK